MSVSVSYTVVFDVSLSPLAIKCQIVFVVA